MSTPRIDIRPDHWKIVRDILQKHVPQYEVWAFGSRAKWTAKDYSDLDLCVISDKPLSLSVSAALADDFSESDLPWKVDVVDWATTAESFRKIIERDKVVVHGAKAGRAMAGVWRSSTWGDEISLEYGKALRDYDVAGGTCRVYGSNGPIGWTAQPLAPGPGVILGRKGAYRGVQYSPAPFFVIDTAYYVVPKTDLDMRWLYYAIKYYKLGEIDDGSPIPSTTRAAVYVRELDVPPISVQRAIAHILGTLDDKIELNRRMNETLEAIARTMFKSWFVDFDPVRAKMSGEPPESICQRLGLTPDLLALFPDRLVDSELGEIPEGWDVKSIGDVAQVIKGKSYKSSELSPSTTALVTLKSFSRGGGYRLDGLKEYTGSYKQEQEVRGGDLIVAYTDVTQAADVIGKPAMVISDSAYEHFVISLDVAVVRPKLDELRLYLYGVMSEDVFQQHTRAHTTGTTVLHLAANAVPGFRFALPDHTLVSTFAETAKPIFESINHRVAEGRTLESLRNELLPKLLSGELRVSTGDAL